MRFTRALILPISLAFGVTPLPAQLLETETARLVPARHLEVAGNFEQQWSGEGTEAAIPFAIEYGISSRLELLAEPVAYTRIRPKKGMSATGAGDLEVTGTYLLHAETPGSPGLAVAAEVKFPTARNNQIGTQKTDLAGYLIASRHLGNWELHGNLSYTHPGSPADLQLQGVLGAAFAVEHPLGQGNEAFAEVLGSTSASKAENPEGSTAPEVSGGELVGTVGLAHRLQSGLQLALSVSYDNNSAVLLRPGFVYRF